MVLPSQDDGLARARGNRWRTLAFLCLAVVLSLTTWFSATAVAPELQHVWGMSDASAAWLTNGVQIGFMIGAVAASIVNLPDIMRLNQLMSLAALAAAAANAVLLLEPSIAVAVVARGVCGVALAGIYPPALKLIATWFRTGRGLAFGALIGALTLGSSLPHLFRALGSTLDWRVVVAASSIATIVGAVIFAVMAREGPYPFARAVFDPRQIGAVLRNRQLVLANLGYFGHMWELYAMWAWFLAFATAALSGGADVSVPAASVLTFCVVAVGAIGCLIGGVLSDRIGRAATTAGMMIVSGFCAATIGFLFDGPPWLFVVVALLWGASIVGDSAQFSAAVTELADQRFVGTALALQLGLGFGLTVVAIWLIPVVAAALGSWRWTFLVLVPGPIVGALAMVVLRAHPAAERMAGGRR